MCYGLDTIEDRKLAYEMATYHKIKMHLGKLDEVQAKIGWTG